METLSRVYLNEQVKGVFHIAKSYAREYTHEKYGPPHVLRALLHPESGLESFLISNEQDPAYLRDWAETRMEAWPKTGSPSTEPTAEESLDLLLDEADAARLRLGFDEVSALCLLAAISKPHVSFTGEQLKSFPLKEATFYNPLNTVQHSGGPTHEAQTFGQAHAEMLRRYCSDKTRQARDQKLDPITGREKELREIIEILGRRNKPNVIIAGDPGVGKSALVDGFARAIIENRVPQHLQTSVLLELDLGSLVAGASYKGEVEDRLKKILSEIKTLPKAILFVDELHVLLDPKGPMGSGIGNLLKPELARGEITVIGATTLEEYRKIIEPEQAFNRRFELLQLAEPDTAAAQKMIGLLLPRYEEHHGVSADPLVIPESVRLAKRYIKDKRLPDSAIDLLDRSMAAVRVLNESSATEIAEAAKEYEAMTSEIEGQAPSFEDYSWFYRKLKNSLSPLLLMALEENAEHEKTGSTEAFRKYLDDLLIRLKELTATKKTRVDTADIAAIVAGKTGIPIGKIQTQEKERLLNMQSYLKRRMVGQEHALNTISEAVIESRSGINKPGQPIGSFFLLGPTGTGKTELAKSIAELLFNDEKAMIRFDMSEFKEEHSAALLYGAPPGYVGYEEGGLLVNKIRQQPYAVVLFDEIEKAHSSVFDVFLQIMDEGQIHDKLGKQGDFSNALILFTSNIGSSFITQQFAQGSIPTSSELMAEMKQKFRPEFLGRITELIPFEPISEDMALEIFDKQLENFSKILDGKNIKLKLSDDARRHIALHQFDPQFGARPIAGNIRQMLRRQISRLLVAETAQSEDTIEIYLDEAHELKHKVIKAEKL